MDPQSTFQSPTTLLFRRKNSLHMSLFSSRAYRFGRMEIMVSTSLEHDNISRIKATLFTTSQEIVREPGLERLASFLDLFNFLISEADLQSGDILLEMFDLTTTNDRTHIGRLVHDIRQGNASNTNTRALGLCDLVEDTGDSAICISGRGERNTALLISLFHICDLFFRLEAPSAKCSPGAKCKAKCARHWKDLSFKITIGGTPATLIDRERSESLDVRLVRRSLYMIFGILIEL